MANYNHWKVDTDADQIIWLGVDRKGAAVNSINHEVLDELNTILQEVAKQPNLVGLIIYSAKEKTKLPIEYLDFEHHANYIHYHPVKHGHVAHSIDWSYSSIHQFIRFW